MLATIREFLPYSYKSSPLRTPPRILAVDDSPTNLDLLRVRLESQGYEVLTAADGEEALVRAHEVHPDLILLDVMMPKLDGISVLKRLKQDKEFGFVPIILVTAKADTRDVVAGLEAGGDDYLTKPFEQAALMARVRSLLRIKSLYDQVQEQTEALEDQAKQLALWNQKLEERVASQLAEIERMNRLQRFLAPQVAQIIASSDSENSLLASHRREITVVFCDLRGFTAATETAEPEDVMTILREYHASLGEIIFKYEGMLDAFAGDGIMVIFNDPLPCANHTERAIRMSLDMRNCAADLSRQWRSRGHNLGFGVGIATGFATLGQVGFNQRLEYTAIGSVINLASRLCGAAHDGQIVVSQRVISGIEASVEAEPEVAMNLKGFSRPVSTFAVQSWREPPQTAS
jgi:class 3 adenylate cyclase/CheY-like chemotaxis protein